MYTAITLGGWVGVFAVLAWMGWYMPKLFWKQHPNVGDLAPTLPLFHQHWSIMRMIGISSKVSAATIGAAAATLLWTLLAAFVGPIRDLDPNTLATVTGSTAVLASAVLGYFTKESAMLTTHDPDWDDEESDLGDEPSSGPPPTFG